MFHVEHIYKTLKHKRNKKRPLLYCTPKVGHFWGVFYEI